MTRAEEAALDAYPEQMEWSPYGPIPVDTNLESREKYQEAYEQAEKDLTLTWEDMRKIVILFSEVTAELFDKADANEMCKETLRRFNEYKKEK